MPVHWMKTPDCFYFKCAYWWLRQTYWSGCMGKAAQEALEKTALALRWWRERPPTGRPPGPAPLRGHSTCTSHQRAAGSSAVQAASPETCSPEWDAAFTVIGLVAQLLNDSQVSAHSVKPIDVQTFNKNKEMLPVTAKKNPRDLHFISVQQKSTSSFHRSDTFFHKTWDRGLLLCTQCGQMAAKHIVCEGEKKQNIIKNNVAGGEIVILDEYKWKQNYYNCKKWVQNQLM